MNLLIKKQYKSLFLLVIIIIISLSLGLNTIILGFGFSSSRRFKIYFTFSRTSHYISNSSLDDSLFFHCESSSLQDFILSLSQLSAFFFYTFLDGFESAFDCNISFSITSPSISVFIFSLNNF